jgi:hypothetical protein
MKRVKFASLESFMVASFMPQLSLTVTDEVQSASSPFRIKLAAAERRVFPRKEMAVTIRGKRIDHSLQALRHPHLSLSLRDLSAGGLSAVSPAPLQPGERLTVSFPVMGPRSESSPSEWDAIGRVIRCETSSMGYRIAVEFEDRPSAA